MNNWLPVKVNHKLGFIDAAGQIIVEPKYDAVGDKPLAWNAFFTGTSNFILVENEGKLGLIDRTGREVLEPRYSQIRPLDDTLFTVTIDSLFTVVNRSGKILINDRYENIRPIYNGMSQVKEYFMVQKDGLWGVHKREGHRVFEPQFGYLEIIPKGKGYFRVKEDYGDKHWGLYSSEAVQILPHKFTKINVINDEFILGFDKETTARYSVWNYKGEQILPPEYITFQKLNEHFVTLKHQDTNRDVQKVIPGPMTYRQWQLYSFAEKQFITQPDDYDYFRPLDSNYVIAQKGNLMGIIDKKGTEVLAPTFAEIKTSRPPFFRVRQGTLWGLFTLEDGLVLDCKYQAISNFRDNFAMTRKNDMYGLLNHHGEEIIPSKFDRIQKEENYFKGFRDITMTVYEMNDSGRVVQEEFFPEVYTLSIGYETDMFGDEVTMTDIAAMRGQNRNNTIGVPNWAAFGEMQLWSPTDTLTIENSPWQWRKNEVTKFFECYNIAQNRVVESGVYKTIRHIPEADLTMVFASHEPVKNRLASMTIFPVDTACVVALFSHKKGKFITDFDMMGVNRQDFQKGLPYARFLDMDGKFGLVNQEGEQAKDELGNPLRFSFIGNFQNGKARACLGGRLSNSNEPKFTKFKAASVKSLLTQFYVTPTRFYPLNPVSKYHFEPIGEKKPSWGYIDTEGKFVIEPEYDFVNDFVDSLAVNQKNELWGLINEEEEVLLEFIYSSIKKFDGELWKISLPNPKSIFYNTKGHEIIGLEYSKLGGFSDEMCAVQKDSLWGFVDMAGNEVIECQYAEVKKFSEDWAAVRYDDYWFFIDKSGEKVLNLNNHVEFVETVGSFNDGLCWFKTGKWHGFIDKSGTIKIEAAYTKAFDFQNGVARVVWNKKTGLIDTKGEWILKPKQFEVIFPFDENGIAEVREHFKKSSGLLNNKGEILTPLKYQKIEAYNNGFYKVKNDDLWGFVNTEGKEVIPTKYDMVSEIGEGLVAVSLPSQLKWFFINTRNERAFKGNFEIVEGFNQGYAYVQVHEFDDLSKMYIDKSGNPFNPTEEDQVVHFSDGVFGMYNVFGQLRRFRQPLNYYYCDKDGVNLFNRSFERIQPFKNKTAPVRVDGRWGVINETGVFVIEPKYSKINQLDNELIHVRPGALFGLASKKGEIMIEPKYDYLEFARGIYRVERGESIGYLTREGEWIWEARK